MSIHRYATQRDKGESLVVAALRAGGASWYATSQPGDGLLGYMGVTVIVEVKNPLGKRGGSSHSKLNAKQAEFVAGWRGSYRVLRTPEEALSLLAEIRRQVGERLRLDPAPQAHNGGPDGR